MLKEAFDIYFSGLNKFWRDRYGTFPKVPNRKTIDNSLVIPNSLEKGYVQWQPRLQQKSYDFRELQKEIGCDIHPQIIDYFTTYWFLGLNGNINDVNLDLRILPSTIDVNKLIKECYNLALQNFSDKETCFEIGNACIDEDDNFLVYVSNSTCEVFCMQFDINRRVKVTSSLYELISNLKAGY
jgi:hypothetical protein